MTQTHKHLSATTLLATDSPGSVLHRHTTVTPDAFSYTPYGQDKVPPLVTPSLGFNGEPRTLMGTYLLGRGYRVYNPVLMRFISADNLSPFSTGGLNAYSYCSGDPINNTDPTGHMPQSARMRIGGILSKQTEIKKNLNSATTKLKKIQLQTPTLELKLKNIQTSLKNDNGLHNRRSGLHSTDRIKLEEQQSATLRTMVELDSEQKILTNQIKKYQNDFNALNTELDTIEADIGSQAFNTIFDDIMSPSNKNSGVRSTSN